MTEHHGRGYITIAVTQVLGGIMRGAGEHGDPYVDLHDHHHRPAGAYGVYSGVVYPL